MNDPLKNPCLSHEHVMKSLTRQEEILESFRTENADFKEKIAAYIADICAQLKLIAEIKNTQVDNIRKREDLVKNCETKRGELHEKINTLESKLDNKIQEVVVQQALFNGGLKVVVILSSGVGSVIGAIVSGVVIWIIKSI